MEELNQVQTGLHTLQEHVKAIKKIVSVVEPTLGPKGLDVMLVDQDDQPMITNAGSVILSNMKIEHPVGKLLTNVAEAQQKKVGDGTTTATLLTAALVEEGCKQALRGIPVIKVIAGIEKGISFALKKCQEWAYGLQGINDQWLQHIAMTASRNYEDIALSVVDAAQIVGQKRLERRDFRLTKCIVPHPGAESIVFAGLFIKQPRNHVQMPTMIEKARLLLIENDFVPTKESLERILAQMPVEVNVLLVGGELHPRIEELCVKRGVLTVSHIDRTTLAQVAKHTRAQMLRSELLQGQEIQWDEVLGLCEEVEEDQLLGWVRIGGGTGRPEATILLGGSTETILQERERISRDVASAVQAAVRGGFVPGGGSVELAIARELEHYAETLSGLERYGISVVAEALNRPISQMIENAGYQALEKVEIVKRAQQSKQSPSLGFDCDRGHVVDMLEVGVVDPLLIKLNALRTAKEVAIAILRIHSTVRSRH